MTMHFIDLNTGGLIIPKVPLKGEQRAQLKTILAGLQHAMLPTFLGWESFSYLSHCASLKDAFLKPKEISLNIFLFTEIHRFIK